MQTPSILDLAADLYRLTGDPLVKSAITVLADPTHPLYTEAESMVLKLNDAKDLLFSNS